MSDVSLLVYVVKICDIWDEHRERVLSHHLTLDGAKASRPNADWIHEDSGGWRDTQHKGAGLLIIEPIKVQS